MRKLTDYYEKNINNYNVPTRRAKAILSLVPGKLTGKNILDIGCGKGELGFLLEQRGGIVTGIDVARNALNIAKRFITNTKLVDLNSNKLSFKDKSFDIIVATEIIEHLFTPVDLLKEIRRLLKDDGVAIVTTPNILYWVFRVKFLLGIFKYEKVGVFDEGHVHFYTHKTLLQDLALSGLRLVEEKHIYPGPNQLDFIKSLFPGLFAYQFVVMCKN